MAHVDILIGSELALHREVLQATLLAMRPDLQVYAVPHDELDALVCKLRPLLVISDVVETSPQSCTSAWITLYPDDRDEAIVILNGKVRVIPNASILQLLRVMDDVRSSR